MLYTRRAVYITDRLGKKNFWRGSFPEVLIMLLAKTEISKGYVVCEFDGLSLIFSDFRNRNSVAGGYGNSAELGTFHFRTDQSFIDQFKRVLLLVTCSQGNLNDISSTKLYVHIKSVGLSDLNYD